MFDRLVDTRQARRPWKAAFLVVSVLGHVAAVTALLITAMWQINELAPPRSRPIVVQPARSMAPPAATEDSRKIQPSTTTIKPKVLTQPTEEPKTDKNKEVAEIGIVGDAEFGVDNGMPGGMPGGDGDCIDCLTVTSPLPALAKIEVPVVEQPKKPISIQRQLLEGSRVAGNAQIHPPMDVRQQMVRDGADRIRGVIKMCLDTEGQVTSLKVIKSTGYSNYDRELKREMKRWKYQPYRMNGSPVPVCTPIDFIYIQR